MNRRLILRVSSLSSGLCSRLLLAQTQSQQAFPPLPPPGSPNPPAAGTPSLPPGMPLPSTQPGGELLDVAPPVELPFWDARTLTIAIVGGLILLGLIAWLIHRWRNRKRPLPPPPDPFQTALKALDKLSSAVGMQLTPKEFAAAVAEVIRGFLEGKHGLAAPRQTTEEFLEAIERSNRFALPVREQMRLFLGYCDRLKFSRLDAPEDARRELLKSAYKLVQEDLA